MYEKMLIAVTWGRRKTDAGTTTRALGLRRQKQANETRMHCVLYRKERGAFAPAKREEKGRCYYAMRLSADVSKNRIVLEEDMV